MNARLLIYGLQKLTTDEQMMLIVESLIQPLTNEKLSFGTKERLDSCTFFSVRGCTVCQPDQLYVNVKARDRIQCVSLKIKRVVNKYHALNLSNPALDSLERYHQRRHSTSPGVMQA